MIDYRARIDDIMRILEAQYNVADRQAVEILIAARMEVGVANDEPVVGYPWVVLETDYLGESYEYRWFGFGQPRSDPRIINSLRWVRGLSHIPYKTTFFFREWMERLDIPRVWIEPQYRQSIHTAHWKLRDMTDKLESFCVRLRSPNPKTMIVPETWRLRLGQAYRVAVDSTFRPTIAAKWSLAPEVYPYLELAMKLSSRQTVWEDYCENVRRVMVRLAWLRGKTAPDGEEANDALRLAHDHVPAWIGRGMEMLYERPRTTKAMAMVEMGSNEDHGYLVTRRELLRLRREGVLYYGQSYWSIAKDAQPDEIMRFVRGEVRL